MEPTEHNRRVWDEVHRRRAEVAPRDAGMPAYVRERLPAVDGRKVLHLQCGSGEETAQLVELGALVTAVDISPEALAVTRERAPTAALVQADVQGLPAELRLGRFDLVYTGGGVLAWLHDLDGWAGGIAAALRAGGELVLFDEHPVAKCLDPLLHWREDYFDERPFGGEPNQRFWRLGEVVDAIARARLVVRSLEELPTASASRRLDKRIPAHFVLRADKR
jgi:SAM-dependent methyltransferase